MYVLLCYVMVWYFMLCYVMLCMYVCMYVCMYIYICIYVCMSLCVYVHMCICVNVYMYICICVCNFICICGICNQQNKFWVSPKTGYIYIFIGQHGTFNGADNDKPWDFVDSLVPHHEFFFRSQELYSYVASLPLVD